MDWSIIQLALMFIGLMASQTVRKLFIPLLPSLLEEPHPPPHLLGSLGPQPSCQVAHQTTWAGGLWVSLSSPRTSPST